MTLGLVVGNPVVGGNQSGRGYRLLNLDQAADLALLERDWKLLLGLGRRAQKAVRDRLWADIDQRHEPIAPTDEAAAPHERAPAAISAATRRRPAASGVNSKPAHTWRRRAASN